MITPKIKSQTILEKKYYKENMKLMKMGLLNLGKNLEKIDIKRMKYHFI